MGDRSIDEATGNDHCGDGDIPDERIRAVLGELVAGMGAEHGPTMTTLVERVRSRRAKRRAALAGVLGSLVLLVGLGGLAVLGGGSGTLRVSTAPGGDGGAGNGDTLPAPEPGTVEDWQWRGVEGVTGRDGSESGYALLRRSSSTTLVVVLGDGAPCLDAPSCEHSSSAFGPDDLDRLVQPDASEPGSQDTLDDTGRTAPFGPLAPGELERPGSTFSEVNLVWVPQVTGDMHLGTRRDARVQGLEEPQQFVGSENFHAVLADLVATPWVAELERVVLVGSGSGGFGALGNYPQFSEAFVGTGPQGGARSAGNVRTALLVDSANWFHSGTVLQRCEANQWIQTWGLKRPPGWPDDLAAGPETMGNSYTYLAGRYPGDDLALLTAPHDTALVTLYEHSSPGCATTGTGPVAYTEAVVQLVSELEALEPWQVALVDTPGANRPLTTLNEHPQQPGLDRARVLVERMLAG